jgi:L-amino acid N-acyltransferase YncA
MHKRIRGIEVSDAGAVRSIYSPFITDNATSFETEVPSITVIEDRIRSIYEQYPWLVYEEDGAVLGYAYGASHRARKAYQWSVEVSVYLHETVRRRGIGRILYMTLFDLLRRQGYANAYAGITLPNQASVGLHQAMGFTDVGVFRAVGHKFNNWHDVIWLQLRLQEIPLPLPEPMPINKLWADQGIHTLLEQVSAHL